MIFEAVASGGSVLSDRVRGDLCRGADRPRARRIDRYSALASRDGLRIRYLIDTHTHADHFSARNSCSRASSACR
jgi:glyoxylase-like metal-dependent hydrolase (beta-lactamase superfamily II)